LRRIGRYWPVSSVSAIQQFGSDRSESGHRAEAADRLVLTLIGRQTGPRTAANNSLKIGRKRVPEKLVIGFQVPHSINLCSCWLSNGVARRPLKFKK